MLCILLVQFEEFQYQNYSNQFLVKSQTLSKNCQILTMFNRARKIGFLARPPMPTTPLPSQRRAWPSRTRPLQTTQNLATRTFGQRHASPLGYSVCLLDPSSEGPISQNWNLPRDKCRPALTRYHIFPAQLPTVQTWSLAQRFAMRLVTYLDTTS